MSDLSLGFSNPRPRGGRPRTKALPPVPPRLAEVRLAVVAGASHSRVTWTPGGWRCSCAVAHDCEHVRVAVAGLRDATRAGSEGGTPDRAALATSAKEDGAELAGGVTA